MKVTVLVENSAGPDPAVRAEFGLSLLIESGGIRLLMDTGQSGMFLENARALGVDPGAVDWLVLSHGHFDHGGGLSAFLMNHHRARLVARRGADRRFFGSLLPGLPAFVHRWKLVTRPIGIDPAVFCRFADRIDWIDSDTGLAPGIRLLTGIPRLRPLARGNRFLLAERSGSFVPDDFDHELLLVVEEEGSRVVFSGCAHNGIVNMLEAARRDRPGLPIRAVVGGFHLSLPRSEKKSEPDDEIGAIADELAGRVGGPIYTGHCTGGEAFGMLKGHLGQRLHGLHSGMAFEV